MLARRLFAVVAAVATVAVPSVASAAGGTTDRSVAPSPSAARRAAVAADLGVRADRISVATDASGRVRFLGTAAGRPIPRANTTPAGATPRQAARGFLTAHGSLFGIGDARAQLRDERTLRGPGGSHVVRFQQLVGGLPVVGGDVVVSLDGAGDVQSVAAKTAPGGTAATPRVTAATARRTALAVVGREHRVAGLRATRPTLAWYDSALAGAPGLHLSREVWRTEVVSRAGLVRELVLVDAVNGAVPLHYNQVDSVAVQSICDAQDDPNVTDPTCPPTPPSAHQVAGTVAPSTNADTSAASANADHTYQFYANVIGDVSALGLPAATPGDRDLNSTVRMCQVIDPAGTIPPTCPMKNAYWDGAEMVYGNGYAAGLDVVGHELSHGVTEHTSNLMYLYQSGAINESMSDVFGELAEAYNNGGSADFLLGEDTPDGALRSMADPTLYGQPDRMGSPLYFADSTFADQGGVHENSGVGNKAAYLIWHGGTFNGYGITGLGVTKTANIYYELEKLMPSAADYADVSSLLPQACINLVGTGGITAGDCVSVDQAVLATGMNQQPAVASAPEATKCDTGDVASTVASYDFEDPANPGWTPWSDQHNGSWWYAPDSNSPYAPQTLTYATSGVHELWGEDGAPLDDAGTDPRITNLDKIDNSAVMQNPVTLPANTTTYLHFNHAFVWDWYPAAWTYSGKDEFYDGGNVEYRIDNAGTWGSWADAGPLFDRNGYNATIVGYDSTYSPEYSFKGFGGDSHGYLSSRLNLTPLAGKTVQFRFRSRADSMVGSYGWFIDDVDFYHCALPSAPKLTVTPGDLDGAGDATATFSWSRTDLDTTGVTVRLYAWDYQAPIAQWPNPKQPAALGASGSLELAGLGYGYTYRVQVIPHNANGDGAPVWSAVLHTTKAGISVSSGKLTYGSTLTVRGQVLRDGDAALGAGGVLVKLFRRTSTSGSWSYAGVSATTSSTGAYAMSFKPNRTYYYEARVPGQGSWLASWSGSKAVTVTPTISASFNKTSVARGTKIYLSGKVAPNLHGQKVYLQRYSSGSWHSVASQSLTSTSGYRFGVSFTTKGKRTYRVYKPGDSAHNAAHSPSRSATWS